MAYLLEFWDTILTEKWVGMVKCILFIVKVFYEDVSQLDSTNTLKFFSDLKNNNLLSEKMKTNSFKSFASDFRFDYDLFEELEVKYNVIKNSNELTEFNFYD